MYYLIYISTAKKLMSQDELTVILNISRDNNQRHNITGILLYAEGTFIQVLEGEEEKIEFLFDRIAKDIRHKNVIKLISGPLETPVFPNWSMGFAAMAPQKLKELEGYINPSSELFKGDVSHTAITILKTFIESNNLTSL